MDKKIKVLIAEDERPMATALELKLQNSGFDAKAVFDGSSVLETLSKEKYDLLLLDIMMPKTNGFDVMKKMKEMKIDTKVIILSNLSQQEDQKRAKELGALEYFVKSDTPIVEIVKKISSLFKG